MCTAAAVWSIMCCIAPAYKRRGYGKMLLDYSLEKAGECGAGGVWFEGIIDF